MLREICPCDISGECPHNALSYSHCEWWCGEPDYEQFEDIDEYDEDYDIPDEWLNPEE